MKHTKQAFTLIELLVVIAIIAILAAILFPVFAAAREKARQTACSSNLKQLGLAVIQYTQDYDEMLPMSQFREPGDWPPSASSCPGATYNYCTGHDYVDYGGNFFHMYSWPDLLDPYVKSWSVQVCPSRIFNTWNGNVPADPTVRYSYNYNRYLSPTVGGTTSHSLSVSKVPTPAGTIQFIDAYASPNSVGAEEAYGGAMDTDGTPIYAGTGQPGAPYEQMIALHSNHTGENESYVDGHVKFATHDQIVASGITPWYVAYP